MGDDVGGERLTKTEAYAADGARSANLPTVGAVRLAIGLIQGLLGYYLFREHELHAWPATDPYVFAPFLIATLYVPLFVLQALGAMRWSVAGAWALALIVIAVGLAWYDRYREAVLLPPTPDWHLMPSFALFVFLFGGLFIAQSLLEAGEIERSYAARYRTYFDAAWKFGLQLAFAAAFVGVFWILVWLGVALFQLIRLDFLRRLVDHAWFVIPATTLAISAAIHLTDVRADVVAGVRTVGLTLLAWLLPLMVLLVGAFIVSLPATGLEPLWATRSAAGILLATAAVIVVLINAGYQDGTSSGPLPGALRYSEIVAAFLLIPLVAISAYALALRVQEYGWTVERIATLACVLIASCYALGYSGAALFSLLGARWMSSLEGVNIFVAFLILVALLALFTPVADPARLAVEGQIARLKAGQTKPIVFDYLYLHREGGRYAELALKELAQGRYKAEIRRAAQLALQGETVPPEPPKPLSPAVLAKRLFVFPNGRALPDSFLRQDWSRETTLPGCLWGSESGLCDAVLADLSGTGTEDIILITGNDSFWSGQVMRVDQTGHWSQVAIYSDTCPGSLRDVLAGKFRVAESNVRDLEIDGRHVPPYRPSTESCGSPAAKAAH